jgi:gamma-glutamyl:cysteine ligase YbdK (ATP-grasp superfamily)
MHKRGIGRFSDRFQFDPTKTLCVGIERESFLVNAAGQIAPLAKQFLEKLGDSRRFGYELSACQLEDRVGPCTLDTAYAALVRNDADIAKVAAQEGWGRNHYEVAPEDMPLDIYPDPTGRYERMTKTMPREILSAACRVIGTHIHVGMPDRETAIAVYNRTIPHYQALSDQGDGSSGERLKIYSVMAHDFVPMPYADWSAFYAAAVEKKFVHDPRRCWTLIRISIHGTIEFRMFGTTVLVPRIVEWAGMCHELCRKALS